MVPLRLWDGARFRFYTGHVLGRLGALFLIASSSVGAYADDIVFSTAKVIRRGGAYHRSEVSHLYRCRPDGQGRRQLTAGTMDDTDPCVAPDGRRILFWRRDPQDLIGRTWLCSILPDGSDLRIHERVGTPDPGSPLDRFGRSKSPELPGIPSQEGGTSMPQTVARLQDGGFVFGYYGQGSALGMADQQGKPIRRLSPYKVVQGRKMRATLFGDSQWQDNPEGVRAYWIGPGRRQLLLQRVLRTADGGFPYLFFLDARSGQIRRRLEGHFVQDVDAKGADLLTTSRQSLTGLGRGGAVPLQPLSLWRSQRRPRVITPPDASCFGACFIRTSRPMPVRPNRRRGISVPKTAASSQAIVFAATRYGENLRNVFEADTSHLYRVRPDGTGLQPLTRGDFDDVVPTLAEDGKHILFWRSKDPDKSRYRLYSIRLDGTGLRPLKSIVNRYPDIEFARAMRSSRAVRITGTEGGYGQWISLLGPRGKPIARDKPTFFSPNGRRAIVRGESENGAVVDLRTGAVRAIDSSWRAPAWVDNRTVVAFRFKGDPDRSRLIPGEIAFLDLEGRPVLTKTTTFSGDPGVLPSMFSVNGRAFPLENRNCFLWEAHHPMSDGGYLFLHLVEMKKGRIRHLADQSLEAVAPGGEAFVGTKYDWVGGYKGAGAGKLGTMYLWDSRRLTRRTFGFRRMICNGACFVPLATGRLPLLNP